MRLDKLVDSPVDHPVRYHREVRIAHCRSQQWDHIWMAEGSPDYNFRAKTLRNHNQLICVGLLTDFLR